MNCSVCLSPSKGDLCADCMKRRSVVRPASAYLVQRAARRLMRLAARADPERVEHLEEWIDSGRAVRGRW